MSHTVWKYRLEPKTRQEVEMPWGSRILKLAVMGPSPCLWVLVDPTVKAKSTREFRLYSTGEEIPDASQLEYVGSISADHEDKPMVIHCFEAIRIIV